MAYLHTEIYSAQSSKKSGDPCGDSFAVFREDNAITAIICDGLGSGVKANISANYTLNRILGMLKCGASMREAFYKVVMEHNKRWGKGHPFSVFSIVKILSNGEVSVLSYDSPAPISLQRLSATVMTDRVFTIDKAVIYESSGTVGEGEGIILMSDGISQAGIGNGLNLGWGAKGVARYVTSQLMFNSVKPHSIPELVHQKAKEYWGKKNGDDCTLLLLYCRRGVTVNLMTGPPKEKEKDEAFVNHFYSTQGIKIVCGGTTSTIVARCLKRNLQIEDAKGDFISPPSYMIDGINLVTEGVVTLNQVYNLLDENTEEMIDESAIYELNALLSSADKVQIWQGTVENPSSEHIQFLQQGILARNKIMSKIVKKLRMMGKLVVVNYDE